MGKGSFIGGSTIIRVHPIGHGAPRKRTGALDVALDEFDEKKAKKEVMRKEDVEREKETRVKSPPEEKEKRLKRALDARTLQPKARRWKTSIVAQLTPEQREKALRKQVTHKSNNERKPGLVVEKRTRSSRTRSEE